MPPYLRLHALAASRGDGLRPEFLALFEHLAAAPEAGPAVIELDRRRAASMIRSGPDPMPDEGAAVKPTASARAKVVKSKI